MGACPIAPLASLGVTWPRGEWGYRCISRSDTGDFYFYHVDCLAGCFVREGRPQRHEDEETDMVQMVQVTNVEMDYLKQRHMPEPLLQRFD